MDRLHEFADIFRNCALRGFVTTKSLWEKKAPQRTVKHNDYLSPMDGSGRQMVRRMIFFNAELVAVQYQSTSRFEGRLPGRDRAFQLFEWPRI
jgi:hypothetical protein